MGAVDFLTLERVGAMGAFAFLVGVDGEGKGKGKGEKLFAIER